MKKLLSLLAIIFALSWNSFAAKAKKSLEINKQNKSISIVSNSKNRLYSKVEYQPCIGIMKETYYTYDGYGNSTEVTTYRILYIDVDCMLNSIIY